MFKYANTLGLTSFVLSLLILPSLPALADSLTLTTYYPSPTGNYDQLTAKTLRAYDSTAPDDAYKGLLRLTRAPATGQYINLVRYGSYPWSIGTVYNSNTFAIGLGQGTDSAFTNPFFVIKDVTGNVGIGVANPVAALQVANSGNGTLYVNSNLDPSVFNPATLWGSTTVAPKGLSIGWNRSAGSMETNFINIAPGLTPPGGFTFDTWNGTTYTNRMRINANGNVGIGNNAPLAKLDVTSTLDPGMILQRSTAANWSYLSFWTGGVRRGVVGADPNNNVALYGDVSTSLYAGGIESLRAVAGNIGIGVAAPLAKLHVIGPGTGFGNEPIRAQANSTFFTGVDGTGTQRFAIHNDSGPLLGFYGSDTAWFQFMTVNNSGTKAVSFPSGNVSIGTTSSIAKLDIAQNSAIKVGNAFLSSGGNFVHLGNNVWSNGSWIFPGGTGSLIQLDNQIIRFHSHNGTAFTQTMVINSVGDMTVTKSVTAPSDARLKQNIVPLKNTLANLDQLRGVSFAWNKLSATMGHKEGEHSIGMIAQEVQKIYPELVVSTKQGDKEYLAIDYGKFSSVLLQSIKELKAQVKELQAKVRKLEKNK